MSDVSDTNLPICRGVMLVRNNRIVNSPLLVERTLRVFNHVFFFIFHVKFSIEFRSVKLKSQMVSSKFFIDYRSIIVLLRSNQYWH